MKLINKYILCIFHKENTASLLLNFKQNYYYCFGCNVHGKLSNILKIQCKNNLKNFINSKNRSTVINHKIDKNFKNFQYKFDETDNKIFINLMNFINLIFTRSIKLKFVQHFFKNRNLNKRIIKKFKLGYSFYESLNYIILNYSEKFLLNTGIFKIKYFCKKKLIYNILYKKIVFPLIDINGNIISFSGRNIKENLKPKYINSYETIFNKKKFNLYGIWEAKFYIKQKNYIILVEGYIDVLSLYQRGVNNVAGLMGTNFTIHHIDLINKITCNILFCIDNDIAGSLGVKKILDLLLNNNYFLNIKFLILPANYDPDNYINKYGKKSFEKRINNSINFVNILYTMYIKFLFNKNKIIYNKNLYKLKLFFTNIKIKKNKILILILLSKNLNISLYVFFFLLSNSMECNFKNQFSDLKFDCKLFDLKILIVITIYPQLLYFFENLSLKEFMIESKIAILILDILKNLNSNYNLNFIKYFLNIKSEKFLKIYEYVFHKLRNKKLFKIVFLRNKYKIIIQNLSNNKKIFYKKNIIYFCDLLYSFI